MPQRSAGLLLYRRIDTGLRILLIYPGGPFWRHKDVGSWQIPKGAIEPGEEPFAAALREAEEELGFRFSGTAQTLGKVRQAGGKYVEAFALEADFDPDCLASKEFEIEWPPRGGTIQKFPEVDAASWFDLETAREKMLASQKPFLARLVALVT